MRKRVFDIIVAAAGLVLLSPLLAALALAVLVSGPGPALYRQVRLGRNGRPFRILKFRSMVDGAEHRGARITRADDARVTRVGAWLRRHKLDELPQLVNVLTGDMSLVGPRPEVPEFAAHYPEEFARILSVRPGVTHRASQLYRDEEKLLAATIDPRAFYLEHVLPLKLAIYLDDLGRTSLRDDVATILATVFNRPPAVGLAAAARRPRPQAAPAKRQAAASS